MKKSLKMSILLIMLLFVTSLCNVNAVADYTQYDNLFSDDEFTIYTDATITEDNFISVVSQYMGNYVLGAGSGNSYMNSHVSLNNCNYEDKTCDVVVNHYESINGVESNDSKEYGTKTFIFESDITTYFSDIISDNKLVINYDESLLSDSEKNNYIYSYIWNLSKNQDDKYISYDYNSSNKTITRKDTKIGSGNLTSAVYMITDFDIVFDYQEEAYSDTFKVLTDGNLLIKSDIDINKNIITSYINTFYISGDDKYYYFNLDGDLKNNKIFIKMLANGKEVERHLVTITKGDIDTSSFEHLDIEDGLKIKAERPLNEISYIHSYFNSLSTSYNVDDETSIYYEIYPTDGYIKYRKQVNGVTTDIQIKKVIISFIGYDTNYSDNYNRLGQELVVNSDVKNETTIRNSLIGGFNLLGCNSDYSICDIGYTDSSTNKVEIHPVNIIFDATISEKFANAFNVKNDKTIDIIVDNGMVLVDSYVWLTFYDNLTSDNYQIICEFGDCTFTLKNYRYNYSETHMLDYNLVEKEATETYLSRVYTSIDVYPGEYNYIWSSLQNSSFFAKNDDDYKMQVYECRSYDNSCKVAIMDNGNLEIHKASVNIKDGKSPEFSKIVPNDTIKLNSIYKDDQYYLEYASLANLLGKTEKWLYLNNFNDGKATVHLETGEAHTVNVEFSEGNLEHQQIVEEIIAKIDATEFNIIAEDLEFVNSFYYAKTYPDASLKNFSSKTFDEAVTKIINNNHISYFFVPGGGGGTPYSDGMAGTLVLFYDGIGYGATSNYVGAGNNHIVYIPDDTADTKEAYIAAAQKRVNDYLGADCDVIISFDSVVPDDELPYMADIVDLTKFDGNLYGLSHNSKYTTILIYKDSSKIKDSVGFLANDVNNNVKIESDTANYPMNTVVSSNIIKEANDEHQESLDKLKVDNAQIIDINLYSTFVGNIKEFVNQVFKVRLPLYNDALTNENLVAYYIDENGKIEEHNATIEDGMIVFETTHFSTYYIANKVAEDEQPKEVPKDPQPTENKNQNTNQNTNQTTTENKVVTNEKTNEDKVSTVDDDKIIGSSNNNSNSLDVVTSNNDTTNDEDVKVSPAIIIGAIAIIGLAIIIALIVRKKER